MIIIGKRVVSQSMVSDDDDDDDTWWGWGWGRLVNILKMSTSIYPLFHLYLFIYLFTHLSIDHHTHPSINQSIHLPHPLIHLRRLDYYDDGISKTLSSMLIKFIKPTHLLCFHLRRLPCDPIADYRCVAGICPWILEGYIEVIDTIMMMVDDDSCWLMSLW